MKTPHILISLPEITNIHISYSASLGILIFIQKKIDSYQFQSNYETYSFSELPNILIDSGSESISLLICKIRPSIEYLTNRPDVSLTTIRIIDSNVITTEYPRLKYKLSTIEIDRSIRVA